MNTQLRRPPLREIPLHEVDFGAGNVIVTMSPGQWDVLLMTAYAEGCTLLEIVNEEPRRAYRKLVGDGRN